MTWLTNQYLDLNAVAGQLYGSRSRLHTRRLHDRLRGRVPFQHWELTQLEAIRNEVVKTMASLPES
jgi:hypothetical protein